MKSQSFLALFAVVIAAVVLLNNPRMAEAAAAAPCIATELINSCEAQIKSQTLLTWSSPCCTKLREQQTCFCHYLKEYPLIIKKNPETLIVIKTTCGITIPITC